MFAGGGSLGAIQVGALRELVRAGERPDCLVGASVGALNACYFAGRPDQEGVAALETIWRALRRSDVFPVTLGGALNALRGGGSLFGAEALRGLLERNLAMRNLEEAPVPVHVVATNLSGAAVRLSQGDAVDAVLASAAIPIAFPSVQIGSEHLIDGAIAGNTPLLTAAELGADRIIVLQTGYACSISGPPKGAVARGLHALTLLIANQMERDLRLLDGKVEVHVAPHLCPLDVSPFNFDRSGELIERAAQLTRQWIEEGGLARRTAPEALHHDHAGMVALAADGFDLVSFFDGVPLLGTSAFRLAYAGAYYQFASADNRDRFLASPDAFLPQYGGLCAYAMARGVQVRGDPRNYRVLDGKLYFNLNPAIHLKWTRDAARYIRRADAHWRTRAVTEIA